MNQVLAIAANTFKETIRDRVLAVIVVFALIMIAGGLWLGSISLGEQGRMMKDFGLVAVTFFGLIVAVFIAASLVHKEVEKRTVFVLFSKPVSRAAFITGKFIGLCGTMAVVLAGMGVFLFLLVWVVAGDASGMLLVAVVMIYVQLLAIMAVTIFFSTLGSAILASVLGICVFVAGQLSHNVLALTRLGHNVVTEALSWVVYVVIPNLSAVDVKAGVVGESTLAWSEILRLDGLPARLRRGRPGARDPGVPPQGVLTCCGGSSSSSSCWPARAGVVAYQVTRPARAPASPKVFVPSPKFFQDFSPSFRTSIADVYYLMMVQYYGEHVNGDGKLDSLPAMAELVTSLSPHFTRAYLFSAFALIDAGRPDVAYELLKKGFKENPDDWHFPAYLGFFVYRYGSGEDKDLVAARWYQKAATIPGSPDYLDRLAARSAGEGRRAREGHPHARVRRTWPGTSTRGRRRSRGSSTSCPKEKEARMKAVAPLYDTMPKAEFDALIAELFKDYVQ